MADSSQLEVLLFHLLSPRVQMEIRDQQTWPDIRTKTLFFVTQYYYLSRPGTAAAAVRGSPTDTIDRFRRNPFIRSERLTLFVLFVVEHRLNLMFYASELLIQTNVPLPHGQRCEGFRVGTLNHILRSQPREAAAIFQYLEKIGLLRFFLGRKTEPGDAFSKPSLYLVAALLRSGCSIERAKEKLDLMRKLENKMNQEYSQAFGTPSAPAPRVQPEPEPAKPEPTKKPAPRKKRAPPCIKAPEKPAIKCSNSFSLLEECEA